MDNKEQLNKSKEHEKIISPSKLILQKFMSNKLAVIGLVTFILILIIILTTAIYTKLTNYNFADLSNISTNAYQSPSLKHLFGTDRYGRDYFLRVIQGGFISIQVGLLSVLLSVTIGITVGSIAGYFGGKIDSILMRMTEIVSSFPFLAIAISISVIFVDKPVTLKLFIVIFILGLLRWTGLARLSRGQILSLKQQEFILAAKATGIKSFNQIVKHLIPNIVAYIIVSGTITFAAAILSEASLSYLGLSVSEPVPTWGGLLQRASNSSTMKNYWWLWFFPGALLVLLIMSINLIGEGLRDAVDPKSTVANKESNLKKMFSKIFAKKEVKNSERAS